VSVTFGSNNGPLPYPYYPNAPYNNEHEDENEPYHDFRFSTWEGEWVWMTHADEEEEYYLTTAESGFSRITY